MVRRRASGSLIPSPIPTQRAPPASCGGKTPKQPREQSDRHVVLQPAQEDIRFQFTSFTESGAHSVEQVEHLVFARPAGVVQRKDGHDTSLFCVGWIGLVAGSRCQRRDRYNRRSACARTFTSCRVSSCRRSPRCRSRGRVRERFAGAIGTPKRSRALNAHGGSGSRRERPSRGKSHERPCRVPWGRARGLVRCRATLRLRPARNHPV